MKLLIHWLQQISVNKFCKFDYGDAETNLQVYNSTTPPEYDLSRMNVPVAVFWGDKDWLVDPKVRRKKNLIISLIIRYVKYAENNVCDIS